MKSWIYWESRRHHNYLIVGFGVISMDLLQPASDEKDEGAYLLLSVSVSVSVSV